MTCSLLALQRHLCPSQHGPMAWCTQGTVGHPWGWVGSYEGTCYCAAVNSAGPASLADCSLPQLLDSGEKGTSASHTGRLGG